MLILWHAVSVYCGPALSLPQVGTLDGRTLTVPFKGPLKYKHKLRVVGEGMPIVKEVCNYP